MVKATCKICTGIAEGKTNADAADNIDHSLGLSKGRPCPGGPGADVSFEGTVKETVKVVTVTKTKKNKK